MAVPAKLDSAWIIVGCLENYAESIKDLQNNSKLDIVYEQQEHLYSRADTPFGEAGVYFALGPNKDPSLLFGTQDNVQFQLASDEDRRKLGVSREQFRLEYRSFNHVWMLVDLSTTGTYVGRDHVASQKARRAAEKARKPINSRHRSIALNPHAWNLIAVGTLQFQIKIGLVRPATTVTEADTLHLANFSLRSEAASSSAVFSSGQARLNFADQTNSPDYYILDQYAYSENREKLMMNKATGRYVTGDAFLHGRQERAARDRFENLVDILKVGKEMNLVPFLDDFMDESNYYVISEYWPSSTLGDLVESNCMPDLSKLYFIFAKINLALVWLHTHGIMARDIGPPCILVAHGNPCDSRLKGFTSAFWGRVARDVVGNPTFRAPEMDGEQEYSHSVDVYSLCKVLWYCLDGYGVCDTPIQDALDAGLVADARSRSTALAIRSKIDQTAEGVYRWPFESLQLRRRFPLRWCCCSDKPDQVYVRLPDIHAIVQALTDPFPCAESDDLPRLRSIRIDDGSRSDSYCKLNYARELMLRCSLLEHTGILNQTPSKIGTFSDQVDLNFELFYHSQSQTFNVTTLLRTVDSDTALKATWDLNPQTHHVYGERRWEGTYIDRASFETVLHRVQDLDSASTSLQNLPKQTLLPASSVFASHSGDMIFLPTKFVMPPFVIFDQGQESMSSSYPTFSSNLDLKSWCQMYGVGRLSDRLDLIDLRAATDWKHPPRRDLSSLEDDVATSILSIASSTEKFKFTRHRAKRRKITNAPSLDLSRTGRTSQISDSGIVPTVFRRGQHPLGTNQHELKLSAKGRTGHRQGRPKQG